jgi:hypothetical protein
MAGLFSPAYPMEAVAFVPGMQADVHFIADIVGRVVGDGHDIRTPSTVGRQDYLSQEEAK